MHNWGLTHATGKEILLLLSVFSLWWMKNIELLLPMIVQVYGKHPLLLKEKRPKGQLYSPVTLKTCPTQFPVEFRELSYTF